MISLETWWSLPTNYSNGTTADGVGKFFMKYPSYILSDYFGIGIVLMIWIISFALSMMLGTKKALAVASFIAFVFSIFFVQLGVMNLIVPIVLIVLTIIGALGGKDEGGQV